MKNFIINLINKRYFHTCVVITIIVIILFILGMVVLRYNVEGETNMPFQLKKVIIISSQEGINKENTKYRWAYDLSQNNDIYIYIEKNKNYSKQEIIKNITIDNIKVKKEIEKGTITLYRPNASGSLFRNTEENKIETISYVGDLQSNMQELKISNQGGIVSFRYSNNNVAELLSNEEVINHTELLKKANVQEADLKATLSFDLTIELESGKNYKASLLFDMPVEGVIKKNMKKPKEF